MTLGCVCRVAIGPEIDEATVRCRLQTEIISRVAAVDAWRISNVRHLLRRRQDREPCHLVDHGCQRAGEPTLRTHQVEVVISSVIALDLLQVDRIGDNAPVGIVGQAHGQCAAIGADDSKILPVGVRECEIPGRLSLVDLIDAK